jgi:E3 ubiquitin-protein ligase UBR2
MFGVGVYFLLQDCTILLLDGVRGTYYPSPYVDKHGEKHRSFRGKPLFIDAKRLKMLSKLWLSHGLPNEVASKRSSSTRVIINGHY